MEFFKLDTYRIIYNTRNRLNIYKMRAINVVNFYRYIHGRHDHITYSKLIIDLIY